MPGGEPICKRKIGRAKGRFRSAPAPAKRWWCRSIRRNCLVVCAVPHRGPIATLHRKSEHRDRREVDMRRISNTPVAAQRRRDGLLRCPRSRGF